MGRRIEASFDFLPNLDSRSGPSREALDSTESMDVPEELSRCGERVGDHLGALVDKDENLVLVQVAMQHDDKHLAPFGHREISPDPKTGVKYGREPSACRRLVLHSENGAEASSPPMMTVATSRAISR